MNCTSRTCVSLFLKFSIEDYSLLFSFFPSATKVGGIPIKRTVASPPYSGFPFFGQLLANSAGREADAWSNLIG
jgi:hypothetical protein